MMLALAVKAAHVFFEDQPPHRWQWWVLTIDKALIGGERWTFMLHEPKEPHLVRT